MCKGDKYHMSKFSEYIGRQFGNPHGFVGKVCCVIMNVINRKMYKRTVALIDAKPDDKVLDIGYGNGYLLKCLHKKTKSDLYGIDISGAMLELATKKNKEAAKQGKLHLQVGDCCDLSYEDDTFAAISSINTVYFWRDTRKGLSEIYRVLKTGGTFFNVVYTKKFLDGLAYTKKGFKKYEPEQLIDLGKQVGFHRISVKDIVKGKSFVVIYSKI